MDFSAGSSSSSTSRAFYSQPSSSQSKVYEISQEGLGSNSIALPVTTNNFTTFLDNEIIVLYSSDSEEEPESISTDNQLVFNKAKGKEPERSTEPDLGTISSTVDINTVQLDEPELYDKGKGKEREHSIENSFSTVVSPAGLNTTQVDDSDDELVDMEIEEIDDDILQPIIISNPSISWTIDTEFKPVINQATGEQQLREPSCVEKVIRFFNLYNYTFDIFDIIIDLSNKYQEIFQEDSVHLQLYHNNPCILLELLSSFLSNRLNSANVHGTDLNNLEMLATEYYEKLRSAEISRKGLYRTSFRNNNFHSTVTSLNDEKRSIMNSRVDNHSPATKKKTNKKVKKNKSNEPKVDLEKILSPAVQLPQNVETKAPPLSLTDHLDKVVKSIARSTNNPSLIRDPNLSVSPQGIGQTFSNPIFPTVDANYPSFYEASNNQAVQTMASTSSITGNHPVGTLGLQPGAATNLYAVNPNPSSSNETTEITGYRHIPGEWPIPPNLSFEKEYKSMMADAIQKLAITNLVMKHNPESGPGELDSVVNKFEVKKIAKDSSSAYAYNESLINIFNHGGMDTVMERLERNISSHLKVKPKENRRQKKKRRLLQKQTKGNIDG